MLSEIEIENLLQEPDKGISPLCKKLAVGLSPWTDDDLWQESVAKVLGMVRQGNIAKFNSEKDFWGYVREIIKNHACDLYRKKSPLLILDRTIDSYSTPPQTKFTFLDVAAARRVIELARETLKDKRARFVLDVFIDCKGATLVERATEANIDRSTAERWMERYYADMARELRRAAVVVFGEDGVAEFITNASQIIKTGRKQSKQLIKRIEKICSKEGKYMKNNENEDDIVQTVRGRLVQVGELAYRNKLGRLSEIAQRIVFRIEAGENLDDIVAAVARQWYHFGPSERLTPDEIEAAKVETMHRLHEIRVVFQLPCGKE